jgi:hypothetical protein
VGSRLPTCTADLVQVGLFPGLLPFHALPVAII